jgi:hypothetical protein
VDPGSVAAIAAAFTVVVAAVVVVGWGTRRVRRPEATVLWARAHGLTLTAANAALARWYVLLAGTLRVVGAVSGALVGSLADRAFGIDTSAGTGFWMWASIGWVSGGWWAWRQVADALPAAPTARLVPRHLPDYAPLAARWGPAAGGTVLAVAAIATAMVDTRSTWTTIAVLVAAIAPVAAHRGAMAVVDHRQPAADEDLVAADDAIRSSTIHLVGAGSCTALLLAAVALWQTAIDPTRPLPYGIRGWLPLAVVLAAYVTARYLTNRPWRVRRQSATGRIA